MPPGSLLLVPGQHQRQRQVIDAAAKGIGQGQRDLHSAVGVVAWLNIWQFKVMRYKI